MSKTIAGSAQVMIMVLFPSRLERNDFHYVHIFDFVTKSFSFDHQKKHGCEHQIIFYLFLLLALAYAWNTSKFDHNHTHICILKEKENVIKVFSLNFSRFSWSSLLWSDCCSESPCVWSVRDFWKPRGTCKILFGYWKIFPK